MSDITFDEAVGRVHQESGLSVEDIQRRVDTTMQRLNGLVSRDGAVHILANELGVQLTRAAPQAGASVKIKDISLMSRNISVSGKVIKKYEAKTFSKNGREGRVASLLLGDDTGVTRVVFWNDQVDVFAELHDNDILVIRNPFVKRSYQQDRLELQLNTQSSLVVNPEGLSIERSEFTLRERVPATQKYIRDLQDNEENVEVIATIVQVYDPRFFDACPQCNKKVLGANQCPTHGEVMPIINFSMSAFIDDGTGNIRASFWKQQALRLTGLTEQEFLLFKDDPAQFEETKNKLLGEFVKVIGKVKRNEAFDRSELTANLVFTEIDPAKEMDNLQKKFEVAAQQPKPHHIVTKEEKTILQENNNGISVEENVSVIEEDIISLDDLEDARK